MNGGTFQTAGLYRYVNGNVYDTNIESYVNFNGGLLQAMTSDQNFMHQNTACFFTASVLKNATTGLGAVVEHQR